MKIRKMLVGMLKVVFGSPGNSFSQYSVNAEKVIPRESKIRVAKIMRVGVSMLFLLGG